MIERINLADEDLTASQGGLHVPDLSPYRARNIFMPTGHALELGRLSMERGGADLEQLAERNPHLAYQLTRVVLQQAHEADAVEELLPLVVTEPTEVTVRLAQAVDELETALNMGFTLGENLTGNGVSVNVVNVARFSVDPLNYAA